MRTPFLDPMIAFQTRTGRDFPMEPATSKIFPSPVTPGKEDLHATRLHVLVDQAARQMATTALEGRSILSIPPHIWWSDPASRLLPRTQILTHSPPHRKDIEAYLALLHAEGTPENLPRSVRLRFLIRFTRYLEEQAPYTSAWKRWIVEENRREHRVAVRRAYVRIYTQSTILYPDGSRGQWEPLTLREHPHPHQLLEACIETTGRCLKEGPRATLWSATFENTPVVIKRYERNPKRWRRRWESCRALRAWSGATVLRSLGFSAPIPLGWIQLGEGEDEDVSYYVSEDLSRSEPVRSWIRREWKHLSPDARVGFRHALRRELLHLYDLGLAHSDCKLSNLRIDTSRAARKSWLFSWTDLEDIRPHLFLGRVFVRNMYQINGSLPREISIEERRQFLKGFRNRFPYAASPWLFRYLKRVTRARHRRELRRICGA